MSERKNINIGGKDWSVRPLPLGRLKKVTNSVSRLMAFDGLNEETIDAYLDIATALISQENPAMNREAIEELATFEDMEKGMLDVLSACLGKDLSGDKKSLEDEGEGEKKA